MDLRQRNYNLEKRLKCERGLEAGKVVDWMEKLRCVGGGGGVKLEERKK